MSKRILILISVLAVVIGLQSCKSSHNAHCDAYSSLQVQDTGNG